MAYQILCIDDDAEFLLNLKIQLKKTYRVCTAQSLGEGLQTLGKENIDMVLLDVSLGEESGIEGLKQIKDSFPHIDIVMMSGHRDPQLIVSAIRAGASDYLCKPFALDELLAVLEKMQNLKGMRDRHDALVADLNENIQKSEMIGESKTFRDMIDRLSCVHGHNANILIEGESGTGKELIARYVHNLENQRNRPFIAVNCAAIPDTLIESELFGHERGAFTGASRRKIGKFELSHGGDIFLDEINSLKPELQAKILRVIQEQELYRVGGTKPIKIKFRVIAATNASLEQKVQEGSFRMDLYHRLRVLSFKIPALRDRQEDIPRLIEHFINKFCKGSSKKELSPEVIQSLIQYQWPGNIRELENLIHSLIIMSPGQRIENSDLPPWLTQKKPPVHGISNVITKTMNTDKQIVSLKRFVQLAENQYIQHVMDLKSGDKTRTAKTLGISRSSLYEKIRSLH